MLKYLIMSISQMNSRFKETVNRFVRDEIFCLLRWVMLRFIMRAVFGVFISILASGSVVVAAFVGAARGHTTGTGVFQGSILGAMVGAITAIQMLKSVVDGQPLSKVALVRRVVDGKKIMDLVSPAILKAYQWQMMAMETSYMEIPDMYDINGGSKGLSRNCIQRLDVFNIGFNHETHLDCPICLQEWKNGEVGRKLECGHTFHMNCIDEWLIRQGTCPICRKHVFNDTYAS